MTVEKYDVALSFAGEERALASTLAHALKEKGVSVFFDEFEKSELWGRNLVDFLSEVYSSKAKYCVMFISEAYARKAWTKFERQSAQSRALNEDREYILPLRVDDTPVPGILSTIAYLDLRETTTGQVAELICQKLHGLAGDGRGEIRRSKEYFRSLGAIIPESPARLKIGAIEVTFTFMSGNVVEVTRTSVDQEVWLYGDGGERAVNASSSLLQTRRGQYVSAMLVASGQSLPEVVVATMNYSTQSLVLAEDVIRYIAAASIHGVAKASKTLQKSGKTSFLSALAAAFTVLILGVMISDNATSTIATLFWIAFGMGLVYPHLIEAGIRARAKEIQSFIAQNFGTQLQ